MKSVALAALLLPVSRVGAPIRPAAPAHAAPAPSLLQLRQLAPASADAPLSAPEPDPRPVASALAAVSKRELLPGIFLLHFPTQYLMTSTFVRFQEFYESPEFKGRSFTLEQFMDWYAANQGKDGHFTYFTDWPGHNIPSYALRPFREGRFDPMTEKEKALLALFAGVPEPFYVIGTYGEAPDEVTLRHEVGHGLLATRPAYKARVEEILAGADLAPFYARLKEMGYDDSVLLDEAHAYLLEGDDDLKSVGLDGGPYAEQRRGLMALYREYVPGPF